MINDAIVACYNNILNSELIEALQALGYKNNEINKIIPSINMSLSVEEQIKEALKLLLK